MDSKSRFLSSCFLAATLACSAMGAGCAHHHYYRVYDPYYSDYHVWNDDEVTYYHSWAGRTTAIPTVIFASFPPKNKKNTGPGGTATETTTITR